MKIIITGGAGFQGSHLTETLVEKGHEVLVLNTPSLQAMENRKYLAGKAEVVWGSVTDPEIVEKIIRGRDVVFHLAARINVDESNLNPKETFDVNLLGTLNVLEAARKNGVRVIYTSSCEVYGTPENIPIKENAELKPCSPYAASKAAADRLCYSYFKTYKMPVTILRFFNIFGERQKESNFGAAIPIFVGLALQKKPIRIFGTGNQTRDYIHIKDVIKAYLAILDRPDLSGQVINFGTGKGIKIRDVANYIAKKLKSQTEYIERRQGEASDMVADCTKAKNLLGWKAEVEFFDGLDQYIRNRQKES